MNSKYMACATYLVVMSLLTACQPNNNQQSDAGEEDQTAYFQNPLPVEFGDPFILDDGNGDFYLYGTGKVENGYGVYHSNDLVNWEYQGAVYEADTTSSWGIGAFWAPEVYKRNGQYYLLYSAQWRVNPTNELENFKIGVAVSDAPTGPFVDLQNRPLFNPDYPVIDGNILFDEESGRSWLYYSRVCYKHPVESEIASWAKEKGWFEEIEESWVYGVELKPDFSGIIGEPVLLLRPPLSMDNQQAEWESRSVTSREINRRWTEGSFIFQHEDLYYMMYSANYYAGENYAVGYATSKKPLGPFKKADNNPVLQKNTPSGGEVTGTGHNSVLFLDGTNKMYCVYHGRTKASGEQRVVFMDPMRIADDGKLIVEGPSTDRQPVPELKTY
jgi:beta-xylosidase